MAFEVRDAVQGANPCLTHITPNDQHVTLSGSPTAQDASGWNGHLAWRSGHVGSLPSIVYVLSL